MKVSNGMKIKVLYEDKDILAIDKPFGISVHPGGRSKEKTITDWVLKNYPKLKGVGEPVTFNEKKINRPGIVHRLDRETSGVLIIVKTKKAFAYFKKQFMDREIKKTYYAIVSGWVKDDHATINKPIGRSPSDFRRRLAGRGVRGKLREAVTEYRVLKRFEDKNNKYTYLEIHPKTGRTHQIRVHMKFINHPVVGDTLYNPNGPLPILPLIKGEEKGGGRMFLHAKSIEFKDLKGKTIKVESPLPKEFKEMLI
jgi:23S rRNA pseudouridine1911/1915/1917 synthase